MSQEEGFALNEIPAQLRESNKTFFISGSHLARHESQTSEIDSNGTTKRDMIRVSVEPKTWNDNEHGWN